MITILTTSYLDQTQAIGLNAILEYYGVSIAHGCLGVIFSSIAPCIEFDSKQPEIEFDSKQPSIGFKERCNAN